MWLNGSNARRYQSERGAVAMDAQVRATQLNAKVAFSQS
jgi:hypothetical protein